MVMNPRYVPIPSLGGRRISKESLELSLNRALRFGGHRAAPNARFDAADLVGGDDLIDDWAVHVDGMALREMGERQRRDSAGGVPEWMVEYGRRNDAMPIGNAGGPRLFQHMRTQIFEEERPALNALSLLPVDTSVPLGARSHTALRAMSHGEAEIINHVDEIPRVETTFAEEVFGVVYLACAVDTMFFDQATTDWAGLQLYQRNLRQAIYSVEEYLNRLSWHGHKASKIAGLLNYPSLATMVLPVAISSATADPELIAQALADLAATPLITTQGVFRPTVMGMSPRQYQHIFTRKHSSSSDLTIGEYFLRGQGLMNGIERIVAVPELEGIGPNGEDGVLCFRPELSSVGNVIVQAPTALPVYQASPLEQTTVVFAAYGGVVCPNVGNHILGYAPNS